MKRILPFTKDPHLLAGMRRNIRLVLEYDGTFYRGWQVQPGQRTVQGELEARLERLCGKPVRVAAAGRTDAGVHALGQVVNFKTCRDMPLERWMGALNGMLPADVAVVAADEVPSEFHSRFDAVRREYFYRITFRKRAIDRDHAWWVRKPPNLHAMQRASRDLLGCHDFTSFCVSAHEKESRTCEVFDCGWQEEDGGIRFQISANRFLRSMVRGIVGTLMEVGRGIRSPDGIPSVLKAQDRRSAGESAPPQGLFLKRVIYAD